MSSFTRPYARAFLEAAPSGFDVGAFLAAGQSMVQAFEANPKLRAFLLAPNVPREAKSKAVAAIAEKVGLDPYGSRFLQVMLRNHRLLEAGAVFRAVRDLNDSLQGFLRVRVTVPGPLAAGEEKAIEQAIAERTGKKIRMHIDFDAALLGGFIARAGSNVYDGSVAAAIRRFQTQVKERTGA